MRSRTAIPAAAFLAVLSAVPGYAAGLVESWDNISTRVPSYGYAITGDNTTGTIWVAGTELYNATAGEDNYRIVIRAISGQLTVAVWTRTLNGYSATNYMEAAYAIAADPTSAGEAVFAAGTQWTATWTGGTTGWIGKFGAFGATLWWQPLDGAPNPALAIRDIAVTASGSVFVAGMRAGLGGDTDAFVARYNPSGGAYAYGSRFILGDPYTENDAALGVALVPGGGVVACGYKSIPGQCSNIWVGRLAEDLSGIPVWTFTLNGSESSTDYASDVAVDSTGNVYVVGAVTSSGDRMNIWVTKLDPAGAVLWSFTLDGGIHDNDVAYGCALDPAENLVVTGAIDTPGPYGTNLWLGRFRPDGTLDSVTQLDYYAHLNDEGRGVWVDQNGRVNVVGTVTHIVGGNANPYIYFGQYREYVAPPPLQRNTVYAQPNPFRPGSGGSFDAANMEFRMLLPGTTLRLYTLSGKLVREIVDADSDGVVAWDGKNSADKDAASGIYLYAVKDSSGTLIRGKVVLIR